MNDIGNFCAERLWQSVIYDPKRMNINSKAKQLIKTKNDYMRTISSNEEKLNMLDRIHTYLKSNFITVLKDTIGKMKENLQKICKVCDIQDRPYKKRY